MDSVLYDIDNKEYLLADSIIYNNTQYLYLCNTNNALDIVLRKIIKKDNEEYVVKLEEDEFDKVMIEFYKKNKDLYE